MISSMEGKSRVDKLVEENLDLAQIIAFDYAHIPGITLSDAVSEAQNALHRAVIGYTASRGPLEPYAAKAIRNALNSLYRKQVRIAKMFPKSLDCESRAEIAGYGSGEPPIARVADAKTNILLEIRGRESSQALEAALRSLSPRERLVIESIKHGSSLQQIAEKMKITKQAVHKISKPAMAKLRNHLSRLGYDGLDSKGFLLARTHPPGKREAS
jgi:RNA polymerase sigma factor (sigma-70 family)